MIGTIPEYPQNAELSLEHRFLLHPLFQKLQDGISEFTFANLYLFRNTHHYRVSSLNDDLLFFSGNDEGRSFFMLPFDLPQPLLLAELFTQFDMLKCATQSQANELIALGYNVSEDRDNYDYLYLRSDLTDLGGRKFHKKRNLIKAFLKDNVYVGKPLLEEYINDALIVLENWKQNRQDLGDYASAKEALEKAEELQLCGGIYYVDDEPVAYSLGEENRCGTSFVIHFEKAVADYKGLWQFVNQAFASILPEKYDTINREQDLGSDGIRQAKLSYKPVGFVKKFKAVAA